MYPIMHLHVPVIKCKPVRIYNMVVEQDGETLVIREESKSKNNAAEIYILLEPANIWHEVYTCTILLYCFTYCSPDDIQRDIITIVN